MLFSVVLLAQVATATPAPTQTPAPVVGAAVPAMRSAVPSGPRTLSDIARERKLGKKGVAGGTLSVTGAPVPPGVAGPTGPTAPILMGDAEIASFKVRADAARAEVAAAEEAFAQAERMMPSIVTTGRSPGAAHMAGVAARESGLLPYRMRVQDARAKLDALSEEARRAGVPGAVR
jgi:hypothetical protein